MPNANGIYNLGELQDRVFRMLKQVQQVINTTTGVESSIVYPSQAFSTADITQRINSSLVKLYNEVIVIAISYMRQVFEQMSSPITITVPPELVGLTDYVQELTIPPATNLIFSASTNFARIIQNAAIYDASFELASSRFMQITEQVASGRDEWHKLLIDTATAAFKNVVHVFPNSAVNAQGLYNLASLRERVFRLLKQLTERPVQSDGGVGSQSFPTQAFSLLDIDYRVNASLFRSYKEIIVASTGYMRQYFEQTTGATNVIIPQPLVNDTDVVQELSFPTMPNMTFPAGNLFARTIQEIAILDAVFDLAASRGIQITQQYDEERERWHKTLLDSAQNDFNNVVYTSPAATLANATDGSYRYTLTGLEDRVFRLLKLITESPGATEGAVVTKTYPSQSFSVIDVDNQINASLTKLYNEIVIVVTNKFKEFVDVSPEHFVQTNYVSTKAGLAGPYWFPNGMVFLRAMDWKPIGLDFSTVKPSDWQPMYKLEDQIDRDMSTGFHAPTWYYDNTGTAFMLSETFGIDNPMGIRVRAAYLPAMQIPPELVNKSDLIQEIKFPALPGVLWPSVQTFARVIQQACIFDAAAVLNYSRPVDPNAVDPFDKEREKWHEALMTTVSNAFNQVVTQPASVPTVSSRMVRLSFSGRARRIRSSSGGW